MRTPLLAALVVAALSISPLAVGSAPSSRASAPTKIQDGDAVGFVTVYGATWCPSCKALEATLHDRKIPFELVDVDREPARYEMARKASGTNGVPLTNVIRGPQVSWILGNDPDAVERAYKGG